MARVPFSPADVALGLLVAALSLRVSLAVMRRARAPRFLVYAVLTKLVASFAYCVYMAFVYRGGDTFMYHEAGWQAATNVRSWLLGVPSAVPWQEETYCFDLPPSSTLYMCYASGLVHLLALDSFLASSIVFALLGLVGQLALYRTFASRFSGPEARLWWMWGLLFFPTITFWSAGLIKDAARLFGVGVTVYGLDAAVRRPGWGAAAALIAGAATVAIFMPELGSLLAISLVPSILTRVVELARRRAWTIPVGRWTVAAFAMGLLMVAGPRVVASFETSAFDRVPEMIVAQGRFYEDVEAGSTTTPLVTEPTWEALAGAVPSALVLTLVRPFIWEAGANPAMLLAALENLVLLVLLLRQALRFAWRLDIIRSCLRTPLFVSSFTFVLLGCSLIGMSSPNLGTISRYRMPVMPFVVALLGIAEFHGARLRATGVSGLVEGHGAGHTLHVPSRGMLT